MAPRAKTRAAKAQAEKAKVAKTKGQGKGQATIENAGVKKPAAKKYETRGSRAAAGKGAKVTEKKGSKPADKKVSQAPGKKDTKAPTKPDKKEPEAPEDFTEALEGLKQIHSNINNVVNGACICVTGEGSAVTTEPRNLPRMKKSRTIKSVLVAIDSVKQAASHAAEQVQNCERCRCLDDDPVGPQKGNGNDGTSSKAKGRKPESKGPFKYPAFKDTELTPKTACKYWRLLKRYWTLHWVTEAADHRQLTTYEWIDPDAAIDAIDCVTEAITQNGNEQFALHTSTVLMNWRLHDSKLDVDPSGYRIGRRGTSASPNRLLIPVWHQVIDAETAKEQAVEGQAAPEGPTVTLNDRGAEEADGHTILVEVERTEGRNEAWIYDSLADQVPDDLKPALRRQIAGYIRAVGWGTVSPKKIFRERTARQKFESNSCTLHSILNGWARALELELPETLPERFMYPQAVHVVNLALAGHLDSAAIYAYLLCSGFASKSSPPYSEVSNRFRSTFSASGNTGTDAFNETRVALLDEGPDPANRPPRRPSEESVDSDDDATPTEPQTEEQKKAQQHKQQEEEPKESKVERRQVDRFLTAWNLPGTAYRPAMVQAFVSGELSRRMQHRQRVPQYKSDKASGKVSKKKK